MVCFTRKPCALVFALNPLSLIVRLTTTTPEFDGFVSLKLMKSKRVENVEIRSIFVGKIYEFFESPIQ